MQSPPKIYSKFGASLGYMRPCLSVGKRNRRKEMRKREEKRRGSWKCSKDSLGVDKDSRVSPLPGAALCSKPAVTHLTGHTDLPTHTVTFTTPES